MRSSLGACIVEVHKLLPILELRIWGYRNYFLNEIYNRPESFGDLYMNNRKNVVRRDNSLTVFYRMKQIGGNTTRLYIISWSVVLARLSHGIRETQIMKDFAQSLHRSYVAFLGGFFSDV